MNAFYAIVGVGALAGIGYAAWWFINNRGTPSPKKLDPMAGESTKTNTNPSTPKPSVTHNQGTVPVGTVNTARLNSVMANWKATHPNATQAEYDAQYRIELWNNTMTAN